MSKTLGHIGHPLQNDHPNGDMVMPRDQSEIRNPKSEINTLSRREMLSRSALGFGSVALTDMLARKAIAKARQQGAANPLAPRTPDFAPKAKRVIYIFLDGGVSHLDSFDYKPRLAKDHGKPLPESIRPPKFTFAPQGRVLKSPWSFKQHGQSGKWCSDLFPHINKHIDELCFIHSLHHKQNDHVTAKTMINTGHGTEPRPTLGSWLVYGLGAETENLPAYIDIMPDASQSRPTAFLPNQFGGTPIGKPAKTARFRTIENLKRVTSKKAQRQHLDLIQLMNKEHASRVDGASSANDKLEAEIKNLELAFRMQTEAPEVISLQGESDATMAQYGIGEPNTTDFGRACLMARRFAERGVRYITVKHSTQKFGNLWDQHSKLFEGHSGNARAVDKPIAGLLKDLQQRGMLDDTLVMFGSEFGRTPTFEFMDGGSGRLTNGRDHNPYGFTMWFAGGGVKPGFSYGATDDYGYYAKENKVSVYDLHATILQLMGLDHWDLTYRHSGRDFRLTDEFGHVVRDIISG